MSRALVQKIERLGMYLSRHLVRIDLVERNDSDTLLQAAVLEQLFANPLVINNNVIQPSSCCNLERSRFIVVVGLEMNEGGYQTFDLRAVKIG